MKKFGDDILQAVVIADNDIDELHPFTDGNSAALFPLVNVCILDYALESLSRCGIQQTFVYCRQHLLKVREYVEKSVKECATWSIKMEVLVIGSETSRSYGDALRDIDQRDIVHGDFILLGAGAVTNADFKTLLKKHKELTKYDSGAAATILFKESTYRLQSGNESVIAADMKNNRLHYYQQLKVHEKAKKFNVPIEVFRENTAISVMHGTIDPHIAIASQGLLSHFSENFDYQTRNDFISGLLKKENLFDKRIYVHLLQQGQYANRISNWLSYQTISQDIINRWAYPFVPDMGICQLEPQYLCVGANIYKHAQANVKKAKLGENVVVNAGSSIGAGSTLQNSVIGRNCIIGQNCVLDNAYVLDNVAIGDGCILKHCVVGADSRLGNNCNFSEGTVVDSNIIFPAETRLTKEVVQSKDSDRDVVDASSNMHYTYFTEITKSSKRNSQSGSEFDFDSETENDEKPLILMCSVQNAESEYSSSDDGDVESDAGSIFADESSMFYAEVTDILKKSLTEKFSLENILIEIKNSRYSCNVSIKEVNYELTRAIFNLDEIRFASKKDLLAAIKHIFQLFGPIMKKRLVQKDGSTEPMVDCLEALQFTCEENPVLLESIAAVIHFLYDNDYIMEAAIREWYAQLDEVEDAQLRLNLKKLIEFLDQSSEEEDSDDD